MTPGAEQPASGGQPAQPESWPGSPAEPVQPTQPTQPQYAPPEYVQPQYAQPGYGQPGFAPPGYQYPEQGAPGYAAPYTAAPGSPYSPAPQKRGLSTGAIVGIVVGGVALLTAIMLVLGFALFGNLFRASFPPASVEADPEAAAIAVTTVEDYLAALADGDAEAAKKFLGPTADSPLLTDEVAKRSVELAPITNISVDPDPVATYSSSEFEVEAAFSVDGRTVERTFNVFGYGDGDVEIIDGTEMISTYGTFEHFDATVNGVPFPKTHATVFPGTYEFDLGNDAFVLEVEGGTITDTGTIVRLVEYDDATMFYSLRLQLAPESLKTFRSLVRESLDECLAMTTDSTPCGMDVPKQGDDLGTPIDGTAQRSLPEDADGILRALEPSASIDNPLVMRAMQYVPFDLTVEVEANGKRSTERVYDTNMLRPSVDFGSETLEVTWQK